LAEEKKPNRLKAANPQPATRPGTEVPNLLGAGDGAAKAIPSTHSQRRTAPKATIPGNHIMNASQTAKPRTGISGAGFRKSEQLANQLTSETTVPALKAQGTTLELQIISIARWIASVFGAAGVR
jgi:hypothetical protein